MEFSEQLIKLSDEVEGQIAEVWKRIDRIAEHNQWKIIRAFQRQRVSDFHFAGSTGYGYNDQGRETLDLVYADVFDAEAAIVRPHIVSGTHAIGTALYGVLRPGDHLLYITGKPYDTLHKVIGSANDGTGSLRDLGVEYDEVPLETDGQVDWKGVQAAIRPNTKVIGIQRSRGYSLRPPFTVEQIGEMVAFVKRLKPDIITFVDNCYGEFTEKLEPTSVGVDVMAGSLIKNPGGGIAPTGGYIVGKRRYVDLAAYRLTVPSIGGEVGAMLDTNRLLFQGLFLAPHIVGQALKGSVFAAAMFTRLGFESTPRWDADRTDLIQTIRFSDEAQLIAFVQGVQKASAVDAYVVPVPGEMPGYSDPVIMAAGTFIQGGSLELSADAPIREPYVAYMQGGLTYAHCKLAVLHAVSQITSIDTFLLGHVK